MLNILENIKDGQEAIISDVIYMFHLCQAKNYTMKLENKELKVLDAETRLILKAPLSNNKNFEIMINILDY